MNPPLPSPIRVESLRDGARYLLPERPDGKMSRLGLVPILFGCAFAGFALFWIVMWLYGILRSPNTNGLALLFALFGVPFVVAGIRIIRIGAFILAGRADLEVSEGQLRVTERAWFFRKRQTVRTDKLRRLSVEGLQFDLARFTGTTTKLAAIKADLVEGKPLELVHGYPLDWLEPLARELARQCAGLNAMPPDVSIVAEPLRRFDLGQTDKRDFPHQPAGSLVHLAGRPEGLTLTVPPAGLVRGSKGLFVFSIIWNVGVSGFVPLFFLTDKSKKATGEPIFWLVLSIFWLVGMVILLCALNMGRRRAVFMVANAELRVAHKGLFGTKISAWPRDALASVHIGPSGMAANDVPVLELQIEPRAGKKVGLLSGRDEDELRWIATTLRQALHLKTEKDPA